MCLAKGGKGMAKSSTFQIVLWEYCRGSCKKHMREEIIDYFTSEEDYAREKFKQLAPLYRKKGQNIVLLQKGIDRSTKEITWTWLVSNRSQCSQRLAVNRNRTK